MRRIEADLIEGKSPELKKGCKAAVKKEDNSELNLNLKKILMQLNDRIDSFGERSTSGKINLLDLHITGLPGNFLQKEEENLFQEEEENSFQ